MIRPFLIGSIAGKAGRQGDRQVKAVVGYGTGVWMPASHTTGPRDRVSGVSTQILIHGQGQTGGQQS